MHGCGAPPAAGILALPFTPPREESASMCLGLPGRVTEIVNTDFQLVRVDVAGVQRVVRIGPFIDEGLQPGDWVLIHVGLAVRKMDEAEGASTVEFLTGLGGVYSEPGS
jgi:hydrogenase expression/formation protein HypC